MSIIFTNPGEIDVRAIVTFGVSVKDTDNPIGYFGTGLKYAIAVLLRNSQEITVYSGTECYIFNTKTITVRGKEFSAVTMNDTEIGFTTDVGKNWELWMAYRELYCNVLDEEGTVGHYQRHNEPKPCAGTTTIIVDGDQFTQIYRQRASYFINNDRTADWAVGSMQIYNEPSKSFFYKGVRVAHFPTPFLCTYNYVGHMDLTEDRTVTSEGDVYYKIVEAITDACDESLVEHVLTAPEDVKEHELPYHYRWSQPGSVFATVCARLIEEEDKRLNGNAVIYMDRIKPKEFKPEKLVLTPSQQAELTQAINLCERADFPVTRYTINCVKTLKRDQLGEARQGMIYVTERAFLMGGWKQIAATLIEEYVHLEYHYHDMTRPLQNWLFERLVAALEEVQSVKGVAE